MTTVVLKGQILDRLNESEKLLTQGLGARSGLYISRTKGFQSLREAVENPTLLTICMVAAMVKSSPLKYFNGVLMLDKGLRKMVISYMGEQLLQWHLGMLPLENNASECAVKGACEVLFGLAA